MAQSTNLASSTPIFECLNATFKTEILKITMNLGVFDVLEGGKTKSAKEIATELQLNEHRLERLLRSLVCLELIVLVDNAFRNTPASEMYLVKASPRFVGEMIKFQTRVWVQSYACLEDYIRGTKTEDKAAYFKDIKLDPTTLKVFAEGMQAFGRADMDCLSLVDFNGCNTVVDLGGSLGWQARELRRLHPTVSRIIVGELEEIVQIGRELPENIEAGIEYQKVNFYTDPLPQANAYILGHILHAHSETNVRSLLQKIHGALSPGGLLVLLDVVLNSEKTGPFRGIVVDLVILVETPGVERSADEYKTLLESEGFGNFQFYPIDTSSHFDVITVRKL